MNALSIKHSYFLTLIPVVTVISFSLSMATPSARAQHRGGGFVFAGSRGTAHAPTPGMHLASNRAINRRGTRRNENGYGFYPDYYPYYDSPFVGGEEEPQPPRQVTQVPLAPAPAAPTKPVEPLVVELRGDHWVRLTGYGASEISNQLPASQIIPATTPAAATKSKSKTADANAAAQPEEKLPPAILIFRDGHREQISRYTIINKTIATKSDYYASGSWTRNIPVTDLNIPATLQANHDANTKFALPTRPNEVVMRP
jgi:hypothetical protein